jgi:hypothetical protein
METAMITPVQAPTTDFTGSTHLAWQFMADEENKHKASYDINRRFKFRHPTIASDMLGTATALDMRSGRRDHIDIFNSIQSLYLSHNRPRDRQIAERITALHRLALEEDQHIAATSLAQFTAFFRSHPDLSLPKITLTPDCTLRIRWIHGADSFIAIEFMGGSMVKLAAEIPRKSGQISKHFASESVDSVVSVSRAIGASFE